jgi:V/A-type H+-transporting ATPase subunit D
LLLPRKNSRRHYAPWRPKSKRTSRRVNALENVTLPRLLAQRRLIQMTLEEREREDMFRLKRVNQNIYRRKPR